MLIQKRLLEQLISLASDSAEYLNDKWITVKPHGAESKGTHVLVKDGETSKQAVERKFSKADSKKDSFIGKKFTDRMGKEKEVLEYLDKHKMYAVSTGLSGIKDLMSKEELEQNFKHSDYYKEQNEKRIKQETEEKTKKEAEEKEYKDIKGFAEDKSEMQKGKIQKTLNEKINYSTYGYLKRKEGIKLITEDGYKPKTRIEKEKTKYMLFNNETKRYYDVNKTEYEYAEYLLTL